MAALFCPRYVRCFQELFHAQTRNVILILPFHLHRYSFDRGPFVFLSRRRRRYRAAMYLYLRRRKSISLYFEYNGIAKSSRVTVDDNVWHADRHNWYNCRSLERTTRSVFVKSSNRFQSDDNFILFNFAPPTVSGRSLVDRYQFGTCPWCLPTYPHSVAITLRRENYEQSTIPRECIYRCYFESTIAARSTAHWFATEMEECDRCQRQKVLLSYKRKNIPMVTAAARPHRCPTRFIVYFRIQWRFDVVQRRRRRSRRWTDR